MFSSTIDPKVLPLVWQLSVVLLASVPAGWASVAQCEAGWEWVRFPARAMPYLSLIQSSPVHVHTRQFFG